MFMSGFQYRISTKLVYKLFLSEFHEMFAIKFKIYFVCLFSFTWPFASIKYMVWVMQWDRNCYNIPMLKFHHARHTFSSFFNITHMWKRLLKISFRMLTSIYRHVFLRKEGETVRYIPHINLNIFYCQIYAIGLNTSFYNLYKVLSNSSYYVFTILFRPLGLFSCSQRL